ncbi:MAG: fused MFS/spermidine synthase [Candidatus Eremiobacteraeota bacterium]|nr:fused MFS/spermidine synthase [Candidatus Eremiobacteraeota bacterium]
MNRKYLKAYLPISVFVSGMVILVLEITASRLVAPHFGNSIFVWANLIGITLAFLTAGYYLGGVIADRKPDIRIYSAILLAASLYVVPLPFYINPLQDFLADKLSFIPALVISSLCILAVPITLLGCISPFAIRLYIKSVESSGKRTGTLYAISTLGGLLGSILPVIYFIPRIGTRWTILIFDFLLFIMGAIGLGIGSLWAVPAVVVLLFLGMGIDNRFKKTDPSIILTRQTPYADYTVRVKDNGTKYLLVNDLRYAYSIYNPNGLLVGNTLDLYLFAPFFKPIEEVQKIEDVLVLGLACGTSVRQMNMIFDNLKFDGVEIDPEIVEIGKKHFGMKADNLDIFIMDARRFIKRTDNKYDLILMDLFLGDRIPPHLITLEFFREAKLKLKPGGIIMVNFPPEMGESGSSTLGAVFNKVYNIENLVVASDAGNFSDTQFRENIPLIKPEKLKILARKLAGKGNVSIHPARKTGAPITDDRAPITWDVKVGNGK